MAVYFPRKPTLRLGPPLPWMVAPLAACAPAPLRPSGRRAASPVRPNGSKAKSARRTPSASPRTGRDLSQRTEYQAQESTHSSGPGCANHMRSICLRTLFQAGPEKQRCEIVAVCCRTPCPRRTDILSVYSPTTPLECIDKICPRRIMVLQSQV